MRRRIILAFAAALVALGGVVATAAPANAATCPQQTSTQKLGVVAKHDPVMGGDWYMTNVETMTYPCALTAKQTHVNDLGQSTALVGAFLVTAGGSYFFLESHIVNVNDNVTVNVGAKGQFAAGNKVTVGVFQGLWNGHFWHPGCDNNTPTVYCHTFIGW